MKNAVLAAFALGLALFVVSSRGQGISFSETAERSRGHVLSKALTQATAKVLEARITVQDKDIVIAERRKFIVVSFIRTEPGYGGRAHVVYDPKIDKIVYTLGED